MSEPYTFSFLDPDGRALSTTPAECASDVQAVVEAIQAMRGAAEVETVRVTKGGRVVQTIGRESVGLPPATARRAH